VLHYLAKSEIYGKYLDLPAAAHRPAGKAWIPIKSIHR
jgi:hypothetical protein